MSGPALGAPGRRIGEVCSFMLGTHQVGWVERTDMPTLFISHRRLADRVHLPRARVDWALDSGGFTELSLHGRWRTTAREYVAAVRRYAEQIGRLAWAAPQDWMCEDQIRRKTGLSLDRHQQLTIESFLTLRTLDPELPFIPVLQGWTRGSYLRHVDAYARAGVDLTLEPLVGLGSICRRQNTLRIALLVDELAAMGLRLHGFGVKTTGLCGFADRLVSADSLAWSYAARRDAPLPGHTHASCSNCPDYARDWYRHVIDQPLTAPALPRARQHPPTRVLGFPTRPGELAA